MPAQLVSSRCQASCRAQVSFGTSAAGALANRSPNFCPGRILHEAGLMASPVSSWHATSSKRCTSWLMPSPITVPPPADQSEPVRDTDASMTPGRRNGAGTPSWARQIQDAVQLSAGAVSLSARQLISAGMLERVSRPDRQTYYRLACGSITAAGDRVDYRQLEMRDAFAWFENQLDDPIK
jgi:hypothetical protein